MALKFADEDRIRESQKAVLQAQLMGEQQRLALKEALTVVLARTTTEDATCQSEVFPTGKVNATGSSCSINFREILNGHTAYLTLVKKLGLAGPQTDQLTVETAKSIAQESKLASAYNRSVIIYRGVQKGRAELSQNNVPLLLTLPSQVVSTARKFETSVAKAAPATESRWQCDGWYNAVSFSEESGDGSGPEVRFSGGRLVSFNYWEGGQTVGNVKNQEISPKRITARITFDDYDESASVVILDCQGGTLELTSGNFGSQTLKRGEADPS